MRLARRCNSWLARMFLVSNSWMNLLGRKALAVHARGKLGFRLASGRRRCIVRHEEDGSPPWVGVNTKTHGLQPGKVVKIRTPGLPPKKTEGDVGNQPLIRGREPPAYPRKGTSLADVTSSARTTLSPQITTGCYGAHTCCQTESSDHLLDLPVFQVGLVPYCEPRG